jgi:hypothetical protein
MPDRTFNVGTKLRDIGRMEGATIERGKAS